MTEYVVSGSRRVAGYEPGATIDADAIIGNIPALIAAGHLAAKTMKPAPADKGEE